jgi:hypothetical protein
MVTSRLCSRYPEFAPRTKNVASLGRDGFEMGGTGLCARRGATAGTFRRQHYDVQVAGPLAPNGSGADISPVAR